MINALSDDLRIAAVQVHAHQGGSICSVCLIEDDIVIYVVVVEPFVGQRDVLAV